MHITLFESVGKAYVLDYLDAPWTDIVELLTQHHDVERKEDVMMFNMAEFKSVDDPTVERGRRYHGTVVDGQFMRDASGSYDEIANTVRRCKGNVVGITGIVLDVDEDKRLEEAIDMMSGLEYVLYTTFRHTQERHKFRIVIPFARPLLAEDIAGRQDSICETFPGVDSASFTVSQSFYFHSGKNDSIAYHNQGVMVDPYDHFEYRAPTGWQPARVTTQESGEVDPAYRQALISSLRSCRGLHYAGVKGSNHAVLTLISLCRSIGLSFEEFEDICHVVADPDSTLHNAATRRQAWTSWNGDRVRRETRDEFLKTYGGDPITVTRTYQGGAALQQIRRDDRQLKNLIRNG